MGLRGGLQDILGRGTVAKEYLDWGRFSTEHMRLRGLLQNTWDWRFTTKYMGLGENRNGTHGIGGGSLQNIWDWGRFTTEHMGVGEVRSSLDHAVPQTGHHLVESKFQWLF